MRILNFFRQIKNLFDRTDSHLLRIEINSQNLLHNIFQFRQRFPDHQIAAVLKSNAYGHGLKEIGLFLDSNCDIRYFAVDSLLEARLLRQFGVKKEIIILGYVAEKSLRFLKELKKIILVVNSLAQAELLSRRINFPLTIHLKIDTGLHRQGMTIAELEPAVKKLSENNKIRIDGLLTHLADANNPYPADTLIQIEKWNEAVRIFEKYFPQAVLHFAATAGTRYLDKGKSNLIRLGIGLYGFENRQDKLLDLKPILSFKAKIVNIRDIKKGEGVGYNFLFRADRDMKIAILPCGYYEGLPQILSQGGVVYFNNQSLRFLGKMSMNLAAVDISDVKEPLKLEDEVEVISTNSFRLNSIENYSKIAKLSPYEFLVRLAPTVKRYII